MPQPYDAFMQPQKKRHSVLAWSLFGLACLALLVSMLMNASLLAQLVARETARPSKATQGGEDDFPRLVERWSCGSGPVKAVRIALTGIIERDSGGGMFRLSADKIELIQRQIRAAGNDPNVRAIIFEVDSPGGLVTPSDELYNALKQFKQGSPQRALVVFMRDVAASGAYYASVAGDWLIAEPTSLIGSIGVIIQTLNWKELSEKIGLHDVAITTGSNKDLLNPFREVNPEHVRILQDVADAMYGRLVDVISTERKLDPDRLRELADGRVFTPSAALQERLIDEIGYWDDALARTANLLGVESVRVVRYEQKPDLFRWLAEMRLPFSLGALREAAAPRLLYLGRP